MADLWPNGRFPEVIKREVTGEFGPPSEGEQEHTCRHPGHGGSVHRLLTLTPGISKIFSTLRSANIGVSMSFLVEFWSKVLDLAPMHVRIMANRMEGRPAGANTGIHRQGRFTV